MPCLLPPRPAVAASFSTITAVIAFALARWDGATIPAAFTAAATAFAPFRIARNQRRFCSVAYARRASAPARCQHLFDADRRPPRESRPGHRGQWKGRHNLLMMVGRTIRSAFRRAGTRCRAPGRGSGRTGLGAGCAAARRWPGRRASNSSPATPTTSPQRLLAVGPIGPAAPAKGSSADGPPRLDVHSTHGSHMRSEGVPVPGRSCRVPVRRVRDGRRPGERAGDLLSRVARPRLAIPGNSRHFRDHPAPAGGPFSARQQPLPASVTVRRRLSP